MKTGRNYKFWFCTGSQDLYGDECLQHVAEHSAIIVEALNKSGNLPFEGSAETHSADQRNDPPHLQRGQRGRGLRRRDHLDAHLLPGKILDPGTSGVPETAAASAHAV